MGVFPKLYDLCYRTGTRAAECAAEVGQAVVLLLTSVKLLFVGWRLKQPVHVSQIFAQMMDMGIKALPIVTLLTGTIGIMLAIQGTYTLRTFGAESRVTVGIAFSVLREFSPLITGILLAGRSGSALTARLGAMKINQEMDALKVMGINPVGYLVAPPLFAMIVMLPCLTMWANIVSMYGAGVYVMLDQEITMAAYIDQVLAAVGVNDLLHGLGKSVIFAVLIALIGVVNGLRVGGGAEGVGRATTRSVVHAISAIVLTDMLFVFILTR